MTTEHRILRFLADAIEGTTVNHVQTPDTVCLHLENGRFWGASAPLNSTSDPGEISINVVGALPEQVDGWSLLLG